jgi:hypothetical protein
MEGIPLYLRYIYLLIVSSKLMPIQPIVLSPWTSRKLIEGDSEGFLDFYQEFLERVGSRTDDEACYPLKLFISSHIDEGLRVLINPIVANTEIRIHRQVVESLKTIASACLEEDPLVLRRKLLHQFDMGRATSAADIVTVLNNFGILINRLNLQYKWLSSAQLTNCSGTINDPIMLCQSLDIPTDDFFVEQWEETLDESSTSIAPILSKYNEIRGMSWEKIVKTIRPIAVQCAMTERASTAATQSSSSSSSLRSSIKRQLEQDSRTQEVEIGSSKRRAPLKLPNGGEDNDGQMAVRTSNMGHSTDDDV